MTTNWRGRGKEEEGERERGRERGKGKGRERERERFSSCHNYLSEAKLRPWSAKRDHTTKKWSILQPSYYTVHIVSNYTGVYTLLSQPQSLITCGREGVGAVVGSTGRAPSSLDALPQVTQHLQAVPGIMWTRSKVHFLGYRKIGLVIKQHYATGPALGQTSRSPISRQAREMPPIYIHITKSLLTSWQECEWAGYCSHTWRCQVTQQQMGVAWWLHSSGMSLGGQATSRVALLQVLYGC